jgi:hypothetical protein
MLGGASNASAAARVYLGPGAALGGASKASGSKGISSSKGGVLEVVGLRETVPRDCLGSGAASTVYLGTGAARTRLNRLSRVCLGIVYALPV